ncbi:hypothetical protein [Microscilla marina]|uniref:hypothetical protein n=1 Tax=Microscilla marina TaxID=1027 RepID=UPI0005D4690C|nr:hypothetical protein [Microscilla marina]
MAVVVAASERLMPKHWIPSSYGALNTPPKNWGPYKKLFAGAQLTLFSVFSGPLNPFYWMKDFGEDHLSAAHIKWGYKNKSRFVK